MLLKTHNRDNSLVNELGNRDNRSGTEKNFVLNIYKKTLSGIINELDKKNDPQRNKKVFSYLYLLILNEIIDDHKVRELLNSLRKDNDIKNIFSLNISSDLNNIFKYLSGNTSLFKQYITRGLTLVLIETFWVSSTSENKSLILKNLNDHNKIKNAIIRDIANTTGLDYQNLKNLENLINLKYLSQLTIENSNIIFKCDGYEYSSQKLQSHNYAANLNDSPKVYQIASYTLFKQESTKDAQIDLLKQHLTNADSKIEQDTITIGALIGKNTSMNIELHNLQIENKKLQLEITSQQNKISSANLLAPEKNKLIQELNHLKTQLTKLESERDDLSQRIQQVTLENNRIKSKNDSLQTELMNNNVSLAELNKKIESLTQERSGLCKEIDRLKSTNSDSIHKIGKLNQDIHTLNQKIQSLESSNNSINEKNTLLTKEVASNKTSLAELNKKIESLTQEKNILSNRQAKLIAENNRLKSKSIKSTVTYQSPVLLQKKLSTPPPADNAIVVNATPTRGAVPVTMAASIELGNGNVALNSQKPHHKSIAFTQTEFPSLINVRNIKSIAYGDLHGNFKKLLDHFIRATIIDISLNDYQALVNNPKKIEEFIEAGKLKINTENIPNIILLGDILCDRNPCDNEKIYLLHYLSKSKVKYTIIFSNHDLAYLHFYIANKMQLSSSQGFYGDISPQARDMFPNIIQNHYKLFEYDETEKIFYSHAPIDSTIFNELLEHFSIDKVIPFKDKISTINAKFLNIMTSVFDKKDICDELQYFDRHSNGIIGRAVWWRFQWAASPFIIDTEKMVSFHYTGHDQYKATNENMITLDNAAGKCANSRNEEECMYILSPLRLELLTAEQMVTVINKAFQKVKQLDPICQFCIDNINSTGIIIDRLQYYQTYMNDLLVQWNQFSKIKNITDEQISNTLKSRVNYFTMLIDLYKDPEKYLGGPLCKLWVQKLIDLSSNIDLTNPVQAETINKIRNEFYKYIELSARTNKENRRTLILDTSLVFQVNLLTSNQFTHFIKQVKALNEKRKFTTELFISSSTIYT